MKSKICVLIVFLTLVFLMSCKNEKQKDDAQEVVQTEAEEEFFRPNFHFTPEKGWMNDPNGMFYKDGIYHLYFQHYPDDAVWGPMYWGHAISKDLIHWEEQPIALKPDEKGYIFSGSGVVDNENTSGFGEGDTAPAVAIFTYHDMEAEKAGAEDYESQGIAYSLDNGETYTKYRNNPVLPNQGKRDFRDPKVSWNEDNNQWVMTIAAADEIQFYASPDLKEWSYLSSFGKEYGDHGGVWETPDLFSIKDKHGDEKWVLLVSINPGGPNGGSATQYFTGGFDGKTFTVDNPEQYLDEKQPNWLDYGRDNYAGVTWSNIPEDDGRRLFIGWMSNWDYGQEVPTEKWRSTSTIARELSLVKVGETYKVSSLPVSELQNFLTNQKGKDELDLKKSDLIAEDDEGLDRHYIEFEIPLDSEVENYDFVLNNDQDEALKFGYDAERQEFYIDRKQSGKVNFNEKFANKVSFAPRVAQNDTITVKMVLDKTSIELFYDEGKTVMTEIFFPNEAYTQLRSIQPSDIKLKKLSVNQVK